MDETWMLMTLKNIRGIGNARGRAVFEDMGSDLDFRNLMECLQRRLPGKGYRLEEVEEAAAKAAADLEQARRLGIAILGYTDPGFPRRLLKASRPPILLYCMGATDPLQEDPAIAVVGSRTPGRKGLELAEAYAGLIATEGFLVVSGLARGIDASAHRGCIAEGGITAAFLAHGLGQPVYPPENEGLAGEILGAGGALLTEYPCDRPPEAGNFIERDRLQSGLADAVLLIESEEGGGALHACRDARKCGKPLAVCVFDPLPEGNRGLLEAGAVPVRSRDELLGFLKGIGRPRMA